MATDVGTVITLVVGYALATFNDYLKDRRLLARERQTRELARQAEMADRRAKFQRETLLDLQESLQQFVRATGEANHRDEMEFRQTGAWKPVHLPKEWNQKLYDSGVSVRIGTVRVEDDSLRTLVQAVKEASDRAVMAQSQTDALQAMVKMAVSFELANNRLGELLRNLH